jgi:dihydroflavonol-4-reductase
LIPGGLLGPYDVKPTTGRVVLEVARKAMPVYVNGQTNWVDVRDVARAEIRAAEKAARGERFVLGHWNTDIRGFLDILAQIAGVPRPRVVVPFAMAYPMATISEWVGKYIFHSRAPRLPLVSLDLIRYGVHLDSRKAKALLDFTPGPFTVTIKETLDWFRQNGYL